MPTTTQRPSRRRGGRAAALTGAIAAASLLLGACGGSSADEENKVTFVTAKGIIEWWPVQFGIEQGIFEDEGLDVESVQAKSGPEMTSIVTSGSADAGMAVLEGAVVPIEQGAAMTLLDVPGVKPSSSVIVSPDVDLPNADAEYPEPAKDLEGLKIGLTSLGSPMERYVTTVLEDAGMSADDVTFVAVGPSTTAVPAFTEGKVDALVSYDPINQRLGEGAYQTAITAEDMVEHATGPAGDVYYLGTDDFAQSDAASTFCGAIRKTYEAIEDPANQEAATKSLSEWTGLTAEQAGKAVETLRQRMGTELDDATWKSAEEFLTTDTPAYDDAVTAVCD